jgi:hypothetical protein
VSGIDNLKDLDVDGRILLKRNLGKQGRMIGFIWLRTDRHRALLKTVMDRRVSQNPDNFLIS